MLSLRRGDAWTAWRGVAALIALLPLASPVLGQNQFQDLYGQFERTIDSNPAAAERPARAYLLAAQRRQEGKLIMIGNWLVGKAMHGQRKLLEAETYFDAAQKAAAQLPADESVQVLSASILLDQARNDGERGRHLQAVQRLTTVVERYDKLLGPNHEDLWRPLTVLGGSLTTLGRFNEAEAAYQRLGEIIKRGEPPDPSLMMHFLDGMGRLRTHQERFEEAEELYRTEWRLTSRTFGASHRDAGIAATNLGVSLFRQEKFEESEKVLLAALQTLHATDGLESVAVVDAQEALGSLYRKQSQFSAAETHYRRALETRKKLFGEEHASVADRGAFLAHIYLVQDRPEEALPLYLKAYRARLAGLGEKHPETCLALGNLGQIYVHLRRYKEAEELLRRALQIHGPDSIESVGFLEVLAQCYRRQGRLDEAEDALRKSIAIQQSVGDVRRLGNFLAYEQDALGLIQFQRGKYAEAAELHSKAIEIYREGVFDAATLALCYGKRAKCHLELGDLDAARADLHLAMDLAETQRGQFSGTDESRSRSFAELATIFEHAIRLQTKLGELDEALDAMERGRARSLLDQMAVQGVDLLAGVDPAQAKLLRDRKAAALYRASRLEDQLHRLYEEKGLSSEELAARQRKLIAELRSARSEYSVVESDIRNASPAYRRAVGGGAAGPGASGNGEGAGDATGRSESQGIGRVTLQKLQSYVDEEEALLLRYVVGSSGVYLLSVAASEAPRLIAIDVAQELAPSLGVPPGPLDGDTLEAILANSQGSGALQLLRASREPAAEKKAAAVLRGLWRLLIPEPHRGRLKSGHYRRLVVIPDGSLAMLPFEALAVDDGDVERETEYLIDVGPPVLYAPSASILHSLAQTPAQLPPSSVLSVGDPAYSGDSDSQSAAVGPSRYRAVGGRLARLPFSGLEASWVEQIFSKVGIAVERMAGAAATEQAIRARIANKSLIHLACHGIADQGHGNLFGALAVAPGRRAGGDSTDDGFLTLAEIYELNLTGCELTILSACDTNIGPTQRGEGVWALSRGFLVAGSRRVVASNWVVDDKAAASLISYFCSYVARAQKKGEAPDYAASLRDARRWVRQQESWRSPYYWATFVLVGPG